MHMAECIARAECARLDALAASAAAKKPASRKRKSTEAGLDLSVNLEEIDVEDMPMTENCDQIRRKINRFLDSGSMTKTKFKFAGETDVSMKSLSGFLGGSGAYKGSGYAAYSGAWEFFKKLEVAGIKVPVKKAKIAPTTEAATGTSAASAANGAVVDISDVHLPGEEEDNIPVYDTCDEVRRKINLHLKRPGVTQARFGRDIVAQIHLNKPASIQGSQIARFRGMKGPRTGAMQATFYGAYVFFEKMRVKEGKPKSKHRVEMESVWPGGFDRKHDHRQG